MISERPVPTSPWPRPVRAGVGVLVAVGYALIGTGWLGARDTSAFGHQMAMTVVAVAGLACVALAVAAWVLSGRRQLEARLAPLLASGSRQEQLVVVGPRERPASRPSENGSLPVASDAMGHFHHPACVMAVGKPVKAAPASAHRQAGRRPCEVCRPHE